MNCWAVSADFLNKNLKLFCSHRNYLEKNTCISRLIETLNGIKQNTHHLAVVEHVWTPAQANNHEKKKLRKPELVNWFLDSWKWREKVLRNCFSSIFNFLQRLSVESIFNHVKSLKCAEQWRASFACTTQQRSQCLDYIQLSHSSVPAEWAQIIVNWK